MNIKELENKITKFTSEVDRLKGKLSTLEDQYVESQEKLDELKTEKNLNTKAVEVLTLVQESTKTLITNLFEGIVTNALQYVYQSDDYKFKLDFDRKGNLPTLNFNVKTPDKKEPHDIMNTEGGGTTDVVSLALRLVLLEISKKEGFIFLDEPAKHLDNEDTFKKCYEFIEEYQKKTNRQFILITHKKEIIECAKDVIYIK